MSTRCQIQFIVEGEKVTVYRHSDGMPESVLPDLEEFLKWNQERNTDIEYMSANFIYWSKKQRDQFGDTEVKLGYGICGDHELHSDIAFFYTVAVTDGIITITPHDFDKEVSYETRQPLPSTTLDLASLVPIEMKAVAE